MSPRKSRSAAIQASKALQTTKKQPTRAKKKPEPKKKTPVIPRNTAKNKKQKSLVQNAESNTDNQTSSENASQTNSLSDSHRARILKRRKVIRQDRLLNVINQIGGTVGGHLKKRVKIETETETETETEEIPLTQAVQEQEEENAKDTATSDQRTIYSCKFCNKDFSSAFVLFLHIRIHEKVGSVQEPVVESESAPSKEEEPHVEEEDSDYELEIKEEVIEEITIPDADDESEEPEESDPLQIDEPKTEFVGIINKNFVENLRKNLSLAMNRQID